MNDLVQAAAALCTMGGLAAGLLVLTRTGKGLLALQVALEFWTAAGLLRLVGEPSWQRIAGAAAVVALRQLLSFGVRSDRGFIAARLVSNPFRDHT